MYPAKPAKPEPIRSKVPGSGVDEPANGNSVADQVEVIVPPAASQLRILLMFTAWPEHAPVPIVPTSCMVKVASYGVTPLALVPV